MTNSCHTPHHTVSKDQLDRNGTPIYIHGPSDSEVAEAESKDTRKADHKAVHSVVHQPGHMAVD
jgi:hypothetical protein